MSLPSFSSPAMGGLAWLLALTAAATGQVYENDLPTDHPSIRYGDGPFDDPVARLQRAVETERLDGPLGLSAVLERLGVSVDSQLLVFSKTSVQRDRISPRRPRAIYFADDVAVASVPGSEVLELAAVDPAKGVVFYTLDTREKPPRFARNESCLHCHQGPATLGVPGIYVGSVTTSATGRPDFRLGSIVTDHRTPFEERWGGWFVSGTSGSQRHHGNEMASDPSFATSSSGEATRNLESLLTRFDPRGYLSEVSDIVALMTLEHQTQMTNLLTRLGWEARMAEDVTKASLESRVEELVRYMLFVDEAPLKDPIRGVSTFTETFPQRGPRDAGGRSLRDFDLERRMFRYPLSYMIYSEAFDALPPPVRSRVYRRLYEILTEKSDEPPYAKLSREDRRAILEILRDTKPGLPHEWLRAMSPQ
jgi:hypothetical protein